MTVSHAGSFREIHRIMPDALKQRARKPPFGLLSILGVSQVHRQWFLSENPGPSILADGTTDQGVDVLQRTCVDFTLPKTL
ncbi:MAG TPA: hypothetical protein VGE64_10260 [Xanthomonadaceae bacterium]